jgi:hypothetical protein
LPATVVAASPVEAETRSIEPEIDVPGGVGVDVGAVADGVDTGAGATGDNVGVVDV